MFPGGIYAQAQGISYYKNNITDPTQARFCWLSLITSNISTIWKSVWSSAANKARLKIVVSTQAVNADTTKRILACENLYTKVDFVAIGPYIDIPLTNTMTNTDIFNGLDNQLRVIKSYLISHANITNGYGIPLSCY